MKKIILLCIAANLTLSVFGCSKDVEYKDSVPCDEILDAVEEQIPVNLGYESYGGEHIKYYFDSTELDDDHSLRYSALSDDINEFGVFHAPDKESRDELLRITEKYLDELLADKKAFISSYAPKELPKLENAETRTYGNYVAYAILSDADKAAFFETVESMLSK